MSEVVRRCIRSTGREFEEGFACAGNEARAWLHAADFADSLGPMASPKLLRIGDDEWSVRWWSAD